jgi:hypothetical protein
VTTKTKPTATDGQPATTNEARADLGLPPLPAEVEAPTCGKIHPLPLLAHIACQLPPADPDEEPGTPEHEHRHQAGDAIYVW